MWSRCHLSYNASQSSLSSSRWYSKSLCSHHECILLLWYWDPLQYFNCYWKSVSGYSLTSNSISNLLDSGHRNNWHKNYVAFPEQRTQFGWQAIQSIFFDDKKYTSLLSIVRSEERIAINRLFDCNIRGNFYTN